MTASATTRKLHHIDGPDPMLSRETLEAYLFVYGQLASGGGRRIGCESQRRRMIQRRRATTDQMASTSPNGPAPGKKLYADPRAHETANNSANQLNTAFESGAR